jgi:hypothetical protein
LEKLNECKCHTLLVTRNGKLVGLLTMENLGEFMRVQAAIKGGSNPDLKKGEEPVYYRKIDGANF